MSQESPYTSPKTKTPTESEGFAFEHHGGVVDPAALIELQSCRDIESLDDIKNLLKKAGIPCKVASTSGNFDMSAIGSDSNDHMIVSVRMENYNEARAVMEAESLKTELPEDYYLLTSSDDELIEIVGCSTEWSAFDVAHSKRLLQERDVDLTMIQGKKKLYLEELKRGKRASTKLLFFGWLFSFTGGLIGFGIAWSLCYMKNKTPEGEFFTYDSKSRKDGASMLFLSAVVIFAILVFYMG